MADVSFTREQQMAIETRGMDLLVSAAAGSGKTAVLVERIMKIIMDRDNPVDIDRLLVVTFTEAAASEMKQRIANLIARQLSDDPNNTHLARQANLLHIANISTIHAFCRKAMKRYFYLTDLDPEFKVGDETELQLIQAQTLEELLEEEYGGQDAAFLNLVECYGGGKTRDDALSELVLRLHNFVESSPYPEEALSQYDAMFVFNENDLDGTTWAKILKSEIERELHGVLAAVDRAERLCDAPYGPVKYKAALSEDREQTLFVLAQLEKPLTVIHKSLKDIRAARLYAYKSKEADALSGELKEKVKAIRDKDIKDRLHKIRDEFFFRSPYEMAADLLKLRPIVHALITLTAKFRKRYAQAKRERNLVDFSDMEHFCIEILLTRDEKQPTAAALELADSFEEVLIDEYQDSNSVQEMILWAIARQAPGNRFMVGDVKQSIYKFRRANPRIFMEKYENFGHDPDVSGMRIDLSKNFRSRANVLSTVNFFFSRLMTKEIGELRYDAAAALYPGARYPTPFDSFASYVTEINLISYSEIETDLETDTEDLTKAAAEAQTIGRRIKEFVRGENPLLITDSPTGAQRPCQYGDIVILLRSLGDTAQTLSDELKKLEISAYADTTTAFFETIEIMTALSFLQVIDNPRQDIHLIAVLHSPVYALFPDDLLAIRQTDKTKSFYECLLIYENSDDSDAAVLSKIASFQADLRKWRALAVYTPISELLSLIFDDTGYYALTGAMPGGLTRQANLRSLLEKAEQYETTTFKGLFHFIRYMDRLQKSGLEPRFGDTRQFEQQDDRNAVRIMTIHKSKGLEFPVVFVCMLGRKFNQMDEHENVLMHEQLGLGSFYIDTNRRTKVNTLPRFCLAKKIRLESLSEEMRVLYVAMTRAKEKLVLTGCVDKFESKMEKWNQFADGGETALPLYYRASVTNFLDFIMPCVACHSDGQSLFEIRVHDPRVMSRVSNENKIAVRDRLETLSQIAPGQNKSGRYEEIRSVIWHRYPFESEHFPSKISISEIKRLFYQERMPDSVSLDSARTDFPPPVFLQKDKTSLGTRRGTAIHTVMEHLDFERDRTAAGINDLLDDLMTRGLLQADDRNLIPIRKIINFTNSDLAERMRRSPSVRREIPFVLGLRPDEIYTVPVSHTTETILAHGIIDCFFIEGDGVVLLDYKSDSVSQNNVAGLLERYRVQMSIYQKAVERSTRLPVRETLLYLFAIDAAIDINCEKDYNCEKIN